MNRKIKAPAGSFLLLGVVVTAPAIAGDDSSHPAYHFQPSVIYRDANLEKSTSTKAEASTSATKSTEGHASDPKYPAAYFTPKIIYPAK